MAELSIINQIKSKYPFVKISASENGKIISLDSIYVPKEHRKKGIGRDIIETIKEHAYDTKQAIVIEVKAERGYKKKLFNFYKSLGFVENKGRNIDYELSRTFGSTMYWKPQNYMETVRIKLRGFSVPEDPKDNKNDKFISYFKDMSKENPYNPSERYIEDKDGTMFFELEQHPFTDTVWFKSIRVDPQNKGLGIKFLKMLTRKADELNVSLQGNAEPFGHDKVDKNKLIKFYKFFGFKDKGDGYLYRITSKTN